MKTTTFIFGILMAGIMATGCDSPQQNVKDAQDNLLDAQGDLHQAKRDSIEQAEWREFKASSMAAILANDIAIVQQRQNIAKKGTVLDPVYEARIVALENKNKELQKRIDDYEKYHSNWDTFKREFNHDMEEIGKTLKEITKDNSK